ncbi:MAG: hypothetical protein IV093_00315 [Rubrivivax sp.]|nr:hypothetical protein [Rubrivivax sp.]
MNRHHFAPRLAALSCAVLMTTLLLGSQLGIAGHYTANVEAQWAAQSVTPPAHRAGVTHPLARRS